MTPPKPEPVEDYLRRAINAAVFGLPAEVIPVLQSQVTALVADAEARGARRVLEEIRLDALATIRRFPGTSFDPCEAEAFKRAFAKYMKGGADGG